jgi:hypothetical protein
MRANERPWKRGDIRHAHLLRRPRIVGQTSWLDWPRTSLPRCTDQTPRYEQRGQAHFPTERPLHSGLLWSFASVHIDRAGSLHAVPGKTKRPCTDGKGPSAQGRGEVSVRSQESAAMRIPIQTAGQCNCLEGRTPSGHGQASPLPRLLPVSGPVRGRWGPWPRARCAHPSKRPARAAGLASPSMSIRCDRALPISPPAS